MFKEKLFIGLSTIGVTGAGVYGIYSASNSKKEENNSSEKIKNNEKGSNSLKDASNQFQSNELDVKKNNNYDQNDQKNIPIVEELDVTSLFDTDDEIN